MSCQKVAFQVVKFATNLTKTQTTTLHRIDGQVGFIAIKWGEHFTYESPVNRYPWDYIAERDRDRVILHFAHVVAGLTSEPCRYTIDHLAVGVADEWLCETVWHRTPCHEFPVLGTSETWNAVVESLSRRERQIAKMIPTHTTKEISFALKISVSTVETLRHRIGEKVDLIGPALVAWCQSHGDVL